MGPSSKSEQDLKIRQQLNLKNLKRHDVKIQEIISSTSYTTVYYNNGLGWVKSNIEGPMFLYSREIAPFHGFFILNRNGLEYVNEFLTQDSEIRIDGEFILFEPHAQADRATGIWVYEEKERSELCKRMEELRILAIPPSQPVQSNSRTVATIPYNQSITLDYLFANTTVASSNSSITSQLPPDLPPKSITVVTLNSPMKQHPTGMSLLDSIFKSASQPSTSSSTPVAQTSIPPPTPAVQKKAPQTAASLLAMISPKQVHQTQPIPSTSAKDLLKTLTQSMNPPRKAPTSSNTSVQQNELPPLPNQQQPMSILQRPIANSTTTNNSSHPNPKPTSSQTQPQAYRPISIPPSPNAVKSKSQSQAVTSQPSNGINQTLKSVSSSTILMDTSGVLPIFAAPLLSHALFDLLPQGSNSSLNGKTKVTTADSNTNSSSRDQKSKRVKSGVQENGKGEVEQFPILVPSLGGAEAARREKENLNLQLKLETERSEKLEEKVFTIREKEQVDRELQKIQLRKLAEERKQKVLEREEFDRLAFEEEERKLLAQEEEMKLLLKKEEREKEISRGIVLRKEKLEREEVKRKKELADLAAEMVVVQEEAVIDRPSSVRSSRNINKKTSISSAVASPLSSPSSSSILKLPSISIASTFNNVRKDSFVNLSSRDAGDILNEGLRKMNLGMEGIQAETEEGEEEPEVEALSKAEFMKLVREYMSKSSFSTALYSSYLARFAE